MKLSVIIPTLDSERFIGDALKSVSFADEIIVVDMGSTDKTLNIVSKYTNKIFINDPRPNFAAIGINVKYGADKAKNDWVYLQASDEIVPESLKNEIRNAIEDKNYDYYSVPRKNLFLGRWLKNCGLFPDYQLRLFKKKYIRNTFNGYHQPYCDPREEEKLGYLNHPSVHQMAPSFFLWVKKINLHTKNDAKGYYLNKKIRIYRVITSPILQFYNIYIQKKGYKDGTGGLLYCLTATFYVLLFQLRVLRLYILDKIFKIKI